MILGIVPCMPHEYLFLVALSSSLVPRIPIHSYIKKIKEILLNIYKKIRNVLYSKCDVLNENA